MNKFLFGVATGLVAGGSIILALHPMNKREMNKAIKRARKMMHRASCNFHNYAL